MTGSRPNKTRAFRMDRMDLSSSPARDGRWPSGAPPPPFHWYTVTCTALERERGLEGPTRSRGRRLGVRSSRPDSNTQKQTLQSVWGLCGAGHSSKNSSSASCVLGGMITRVFYSLSLFHFSLFGSRGPDLRGEIYNGRRQDHFHPLDRRSPDLGSPEPSFLERTIIRINWRAASQP